MRMGDGGGAPATVMSSTPHCSVGSSRRFGQPDAAAATAAEAVIAWRVETGAHPKLGLGVSSHLGRGEYGRPVSPGLWGVTVAMPQLVPFPDPLFACVMTSRARARVATSAASSMRSGKVIARIRRASACSGSTSAQVTTACGRCIVCGAVAGLSTHTSCAQMRATARPQLETCSSSRIRKEGKSRALLCLGTMSSAANSNPQVVKSSQDIVLSTAEGVELSHRRRAFCPHVCAQGSDLDEGGRSLCRETPHRGSRVGPADKFEALKVGPDCDAARKTPTAPQRLLRPKSRQPATPPE